MSRSSSQHSSFQSLHSVYTQNSKFVKFDFSDISAIGNYLWIYNFIIIIAAEYLSPSAGTYRTEPTECPLAVQAYGKCPFRDHREQRLSRFCFYAFLSIALPLFYGMLSMMPIGIFFKVREAPFLRYLYP